MRGLINKLRTCSQTERKGLALELAQTKSEIIVDELIRMIMAKHRRGIFWYSFEDQLTGIEALGLTQNLRALCFFGWLYSSKVKVPVLENCRTEEFVICEGYTFVYFPHAKGKLKNNLKYFATYTDRQYPPNSSSSISITQTFRKEQSIDDDLTKIFSSQPHILIQKSIKSLEHSVGREAIISTNYVSQPVAFVGVSMPGIEQNGPDLEYVYMRFSEYIDLISYHTPQAYMKRNH
ncbi:hypothetical protein HY636_04185 [Candidatus Woesearchaeota archaeon]|nr:hypothetical protein [Candidatus Woesearchaeota archaeon]